MLDKLLVDAASTAGAEVREATLVREVIRDGDRVVGARAVDVSGETIEARASLVIGADGLNSSVGGVELFLRDGRDILVFPTRDGLTCIWVGRANSDWSGSTPEAAFLTRTIVLTY